MKKSKKDKDLRIEATGIIASCGVASLAICAVFGGVLGGGLVLPALVIGGTSISIMSVWISPRFQQPKKQQKVFLAMQAKIDTLERRLGDAEMIESFEDRLATKEAKLRIEPIHNQMGEDEVADIYGASSV